jgi:hypothetical protein
MKIKFKGNKSAKILPIFLVISMTTFISCSEKKSNFNISDYKNFIFNGQDYKAENEEIYIAPNEENIPYIYYKNGDTPVPLIRDCFADKEMFGLAEFTFVENDNLYYLNQYDNGGYAIVKLNLEDFSRKNVYEIKGANNERMDMLFGFGQYLPSKKPEDNHIYSFFILENQLFISKIDGIFQIDLNSQKSTCIYTGNSRNFGCADGSIFYINDVLDLYRYDIEKKTNTKLNAGKMRYFYLAENKIFYEDLLTEKFYSINFDGTQKEIASDFNPENFY